MENIMSKSYDRTPELTLDELATVSGGSVATACYGVAQDFIMKVEDGQFHAWLNNYSAMMDHQRMIRE
jgi:hypothetical protein